MPIAVGKFGSAIMSLSAQYASNSAEKARLLFTIQSFPLVNAILLSLFTLAFGKQLSLLITGSEQNGQFLLWAFWAQFLNTGTYYFLIFFRNEEDAKRFFFYNLFIVVVNIVVSFLLVAVFRIGVIGLLYSQVVSSGLVFLIMTAKFVLYSGYSFDLSMFKNTFSIAYPLTPKVFFGVFNNQFDKYMVGLLASVGGVGIYDIGQRFSRFVFTFMTGVQNVFSPQVYKKMFDLGEKGGEEVGRYLTPFAYVCIAFALMVGLFSEEIIVLLTPKPYHGAIDIVTILTMFYGSMFFGKQPQLIFVKKTHVTTLLTLISIILNVSLIIPFVMKWGAMGAAWGTLIAGIISGSISFVVSQYYYEINWQYKKLGMMFLILFSSSLLMILLRHFAIVYELRLLIKLLFLLSFIYVGIKSGVITSNNVMLIKSLFLNFKKTNEITI